MRSPSKRLFSLRFFLLAFCLFFGSSALAQQPFFLDRSFESGMQDEHIYRQLGVAWADYDQDGLQDVFIATTPQNRLFLNQGGNQFDDVAAEAGVADAAGEGSVGVWGDYDADGDMDLFVGNLSRVADDQGAQTHQGIHNRLYRNDGGAFTDVAAEAGVSGAVEGVTGGTTSANWADYDNDGWIDLLVCNRQYGVFLYRNQGDGTFAEVSMEVGLHEPHLPSVEHGVWADYDRDGDLDLFLSAGEAMMMHDMDMNGMTVQQMDMPMTRNVLFQNQGGVFRDVTEEAGLVYEENAARSHSAVWGDYNNDGYPDLFSGNRGSVTMGTLAKSRLYRNNQDGSFTDVTDAAGFYEEHSVFGGAWADVNNDGHLDLYIAIHPDMRDHPDHHINPTRIPHPLYISNGDGTFTDVNADILDLPVISGITDLGHQGGAAFGDSDNDGDLDLVVVEAMGLGPMRFYENANAALGNNWIGLNLRSETRNTHALGAKITVETPWGDSLYREVGLGACGWASQMSYRQVIGVGGAERVNVHVVWPNGQAERHEGLAVNQTHSLMQSDASIGAWAIYE